ncbi:hypothetical protein KU6B_48090 [Mameliella alba]|uniref:hypothetical protein n=1 Tax=Mameliella alba TaxID=561184 RepID=UPI0013E44C99|nr:hypothetical protein [Mameliella alba]BBU58544.1 hypothetical protein KU6B_48090 [Mameliella alba]
MTRPPHKWTSAEIAQHIHGMGEAPRECDTSWLSNAERRIPKPDLKQEAKPERDSSPFWIAALVLFVVLNFGSSIFWGGK